MATKTQKTQQFLFVFFVAIKKFCNKVIMSTFEIRPYHPTDLTALYRICLGTGDSGQDAAHLYRDPDVIGRDDILGQLASEI